MLRKRSYKRSWTTRPGLSVMALGRTSEDFSHQEAVQAIKDATGCGGITGCFIFSLRVGTTSDAWSKVPEVNRCLTGVSDANEIIQKFLTQEDTQKNLQQLTKENQETIDRSICGLRSS